MTRKSAGKSSPEQPEALFRPFQYIKLAGIGPVKRLLCANPLLSFALRYKHFCDGGESNKYLNSTKLSSLFAAIMGGGRGGRLG